MSEFDYQWCHIPSPNIEYNDERKKEFREFTQIPDGWFRGKKCLDAGCGNGRYTFVMQEFGAQVTSFDFSHEAVKQCQKVNPKAYQFNIFDLDDKSEFDFVLSWGVLHHTHDPEAAFKKVAAKVKPGGRLHVYLYHRDSQWQYLDRRRHFKSLKTIPEKMAYVQQIADRYDWDFHGIWDSLVPTYNFGLTVPQVTEWFKAAGFKDIRVITEVDINMNATKI